MFLSENFSTKDLGLRKVLSNEVGGSGLPSVLVAKSSCGGRAGAGVAARIGAVEEAGAADAVATAAGGCSVSMVAKESSILRSEQNQDCENPGAMKPL